jgi:hypothetical protein
MCARIRFFEPLPNALARLPQLAASLVPGGILVLKENRLFYGDPSSFMMSTPTGNFATRGARFEITRTDEQHCVLIERAGLEVLGCAPAGETNFWTLRVRGVQPKPPAIGIANRREMD